jgi:predicted amidohydrolase
MIRVATCQYRTGNDVDANLQKLLSMIDAAEAGGAALLAAPEFGNHTSLFDSAEHAWEHAVTEDGPYVTAVQDRARLHGIHVVFNATRRSESPPNAFISNFLIAPDGALIGRDDKQVLMSGESRFLNRSDHTGRVFDTGIGRVAMMSCLDGVPPETARVLALAGAQIIVNTHNSCALDEPFGHIPARAAENAVFVIAAGKVGPVCVDEMVEPLAERLGLPQHTLTAWGENPILGRDGEVLAQLPHLEEGVAFADIDPAESDDKNWGDGDLFGDRRPGLYGDLLRRPVAPTGTPTAAFDAAIVQMRSDRPARSNVERGLDLVADAAANGARLVVLPELFSFTSADLTDELPAALSLAEEAEAQLAALCRDEGIFVACSLPTDDAGPRHTGLLIDDTGTRAGTYHQSHVTASDRRWCLPGDDLPVWDTKLGRIAMMIGYDAVFPEVASSLALRGAEILVHPTTWRFEWEPGLVLPERASENRVTILSAARWDSPIRRGGTISALGRSQPLRAADLNPIWPVEAPQDREGHVHATVHPERSRDKDLLGFDLLAGRRPELYESLVAAIAPVHRSGACS